MMSSRWRRGTQRRRRGSVSRRGRGSRGGRGLPGVLPCCWSRSSPQALPVPGRQAQVAAVHLVQVDAVAALAVVDDRAQLLGGHLRLAHQACTTAAA